MTNLIPRTYRHEPETDRKIKKLKKHLKISEAKVIKVSVDEKYEKTVNR